MLQIRFTTTALRAAIWSTAWSAEFDVEAYLEYHGIERHPLEQTRYFDAPNGKYFTTDELTAAVGSLSMASSARRRLSAAPR